jgi:hypothetical protein
MGGAEASLRHDAFGREDERRVASASATRPSSAWYRVRGYYLPVIDTRPPAAVGVPDWDSRAEAPTGRGRAADEVDFALQVLRGGAEVVEAYSVLLVLEQFGSDRSY